MKRLTVSGHACTETLALLIVIAWADGHLEEREKNGLRGAAEVLNLSKEMRARLDLLLEQPLPFDQLLLETLTPKEGAFAFVAATWLTGVDDEVHPKEQAVLDHVASVLGLSSARKEELAAIARDIAPLGRKKHDWTNEVAALFHAIGPRLETPNDEV